MSKEMNDIFIKLIENLDSKITNLATDITKISIDLNGVKTTLLSVEEQTKKTNGRVTKLEDHDAILTNLLSKQNGVYEQNLLNIKNLIETRGSEIDEIKKKVYSKEVLDTSKTQLETVKITENSKVKIAVWSGVFTIIGSLITFLITIYSK